MKNLRTAADGRIQCCAKEMCRYLAFLGVEVVQEVQRVPYRMEDPGFVSRTFCKL
jgi:hypothetical protein